MLDSLLLKNPDGRHFNLCFVNAVVQILRHNLNFQQHVYTMIFLKWNRLNRNYSGCVYCREIMNIASECPLKTIYATFFTFWVVAS